MINYNDKTFKVDTNSNNGETSSRTVFHYRQNANVLTAEYAGGEIIKGHLIGLVDDNGCIDMHYHHLNKLKEFKTGISHSTPEVLPDGKIRLHESWQWTYGDDSKGTSILIEM